MKIEHAIHKLFPTAVFQFQIDDDEFNGRQLDLLREQEFTQKSEGKVLTTSGDLHAQPRFSELNTMLRSCLEHVRQAYAFQCKEFEVNCMWGNKTMPGDNHHHHYHPNAYFSGVYSPGNVAESIVFRDPSMQLKQSCLGVTNGESDHLDAFSCARQAQQQAGSVYIFPWYLQHQVASNPGPDPRYTIAFNAVPRGPLGSLENLTFLSL